MGQTIAEKAIADKTGRDVEPGEIVKVEYDLAANHDIHTPPAVDRLDEWGVDEVADPDRVAIVPDHLIPAHDESSQHNYTVCKEFAEEQGIETFYSQRDTGLMHAVLPEDGHVKPGDVVLAADSHTITYGAIGALSAGVGITDLAFAWAEGWTWLRVPETVRLEYHGSPEDWVRGKDIVLRTLNELGEDGTVYKAVEFSGPLLEDLPMDDRFSISNMAIEFGAQYALFEPDQVMRDYVTERVDETDITFYESDDDAEYDDVVTFDLDGMEPQIAVPDSPSNGTPISEVERRSVDQVVVGSCTNCRVEDIRLAAEILEGNEIDPDVRMYVTPGSQQIERKALEEGWTETFHKAGANVGDPGCGACFGVRLGVLDEQEVAISTTNRNFVGRMGAESSDVYLANPAVAAASAITGEITHPEEVV